MPPKGNKKKASKASMKASASTPEPESSEASSPVPTPAAAVANAAAAANVAPPAAPAKAPLAETTNTVAAASTGSAGSGMAAFALPNVVDNPAGWGPSQIPFHLTQIPYAPYSKSDRLGKIADWSAPPDMLASGASGMGGAGVRDGRDGAGDRQGLGPDGQPIRSRRNFRLGGPEAFGTGTASAFAFAFSAEDEASFSVVDRAGPIKRPGGLGGGFRSSRGGRGGFFNRGGFGSGNSGGSGGRGGFKGQGGGQGGNQGGRGGNFGARRGYRYNDKPQRIRDSSVQVTSDWKLEEEIDFLRLNKLYFEVDEPEDISAIGSLAFYDKSFDRISTKFEKPLQQFERTFLNVTTSADPVIQDLASTEEGTIVFATDNILSTLMCAARSLYSWDIIITKNGNKVFLDKRDGGNFDFVTVNENAADPPMEGSDKDGPNTPVQLAQEATYILRNYSQQSVKDSERFNFPSPNVFESYASESEPLPSGAYRYRRWAISEDIDLIARTSLDAVVHAPGTQSSQAVSEDCILTEGQSSYPSSEVIFITNKTLNEFDSRAAGAGGAPDWRQKLDAQRGAVMATEIKNNGNKLSRWTTEALLSGADQIRIGFVSRLAPKDRLRHSILGTAFFKPKEFASQINLQMENGWGVLRTFVDLVLQRGDGKYVLVKDPNKPIVRLYSVPPGTFDDEADA